VSSLPSIVVLVPDHRIIPPCLIIWSRPQNNHSLVVIARMIARHVVMHGQKVNDPAVRVGVQQQRFVLDQTNIARESMETGCELANVHLHGRRRRRIIALSARHGQVPEMAPHVAARKSVCIVTITSPVVLPDSCTTDDECLLFSTS
jgi:hypothetical protein